MPLQETSGAASYDAFGGGVAKPVFIEDVFSTYLYTGIGPTDQTITTGLDISTYGGSSWFKARSISGEALTIFNTDNTYGLETNSTGVNSRLKSNFWVPSTTGMNIDPADSGNPFINQNGTTYVSWNFRKQPKFFDVVTYTGTGSATTIAHNLGSVPGCIIVKRTDTAAAWAVYHRSLANTEYLVLNTAAAKATGATWWNSTTPTSAVFSVGTDASVNASGGTYVAYLFAHNAGGFGLSGTDNVISCGSYTTASTSDSPIISLGYEPQLVLVKLTNTSGDWRLFDNMRGVVTGAPGGHDRLLLPNSSAAETASDYITFNSTGFQQSPDIDTGANSYIYIAIRRGPMKVPTSGTSVFGLSARTGTGANVTVTGSAGVSDAVLVKNRGSAVASLFSSRLTGTDYLVTSDTGSVLTAGTTILQANPWDVMDGVKVGTTSTITNASANTFINYLFDRAPGFFDVVCYTGTGVARTVAHNLAAAPEMMIIKNRESGTRAWRVYHVNLGNTYYLTLNSDVAKAASSAFWNSTTPTSSVFSVGTSSDVNQSTLKLIAYLFATVAGVSKVGSYTGTGTTLQINCGFTAGSRFVMIKRTDSTGDWYVWDSARGIVAGNDPYLLVNSTAAEVTSTDYIDTAASGFEISSTAPAAINANGGSFIFFAVA
jgi:hypothetical protein